jgi:hypothetical protein
MRFPILTYALFIPVLQICTQAHAAGGHHLVDDANMLDRGQCHVETWGEVYQRGGELFHVAPGCRAGFTELSLAFEYDNVDFEPIKSLEPQIKTVLNPDDDVRVAFVFNSAIETGGRHGESNIYIPLTVDKIDGIEIHANLGYSWERGEHSSLIWGFAAEPAITQRLHAIGEIAQLADKQRIIQLGLRYYLIPELLNFDLSIARRLNRERDNYLTAGITWTFDY